MKKQISALLFASILLSLVSCGDTASAGNDTASADTAATTPVETEKDLYADLPEKDYGGYKFRFMSIANETSYQYVEMVIEESNGDVLNDAIYERNRRVEEKLNVDFEYIGMSNVKNAISQSVLAGSDDYDAAFDATNNLGVASATGIYYNLYNMDEIHLDKPWWDSNTAQQYTVMDKLYFVQGDLNYQYLYNMWSCFFNQKLIEDNHLDNPYDLVLNGTWTLDNMTKLCRGAMQDVNGDGLYSLADSEDICGIVSNSSSFLAFLHGANERLINKDKDGMPVFTGLTDHFSAVYDKILTMCGSDGVFTSYGSMTNDERFGKFASGRFLFSMMMVGSSEHLRDMESDFGIVPLPKFDENQDRYYSYVGPSVMCLCVPVTCPDPERTGIILEHLSAYSYNTIRPAYFEVTLQKKFLRDDISAQMLDYIYNNIDAELGYVFKFANIFSTYTDAITNGSGIASAFASADSAVQAAIDSFIEDIQGLS